MIAPNNNVASKTTPKTVVNTMSLLTIIMINSKTVPVFTVN